MDRLAGFFHFFLLMLFANVIAGNSCSFDPSSYYALRYEQFNLTVNFAFDPDAERIWLECSQDQKYMVDPAPQANFTCSYSSSGLKYPNAKIFGHNWNVLAECTATATIVNLAIIEISASQQVQKGSIVPVKVVVNNLSPFSDYDDVLVFLRDGKDNVLIGEQSISIDDGESMDVYFEWDTANSSTGVHLLTANVTKANHTNANSTLVNVIPVAEILQLGNSSTNSSITVTTITNAPTNTTLEYWAGSEASNSNANSSYSELHNVTVGNLAVGTQYGFRLTHCTVLNSCVSSEHVFFTLQNQIGTPSPSPAASASPSASPTTTPAPSPSANPTADIPVPTSQAPSGEEPTPTEEATAVPEPEASIAAEPTSENRGVYYRISNDEVIAQLGEVLNSSDLSEVQNSSMKEQFFIIEVPKSEFDPPVIRPNQRVRIKGITNSRSKLTSVDCYISPNVDLPGVKEAECICINSYPQGVNYTNFWCEITPKFPQQLGKSYTIRLSNEDKEGGVFTAEIAIGQPGKLTRRAITSNRSEWFTYIALFIGVMLAIYAVYHILLKFEREQRKADMLVQQKTKIIADMDTLKLHYLKRDIDYDTYTLAMNQKQKELTEVNTRIAEIENKLQVEGKKKIREIKTVEKGVQAPIQDEDDARSIDAALEELGRDSPNGKTIPKDEGKPPAKK